MIQEPAAESQRNSPSSLFFPIPDPAAESLFFRDTVGLKLLKRTVEHSLMRPWSPDRQLRVWVPQCATGHDAYSVAICLIEAMGSRWREIPLRVFFTDSDMDSLARARSGRYPRDSCRDLSRETFGRFFTEESGGIRVRPFVRDACRFAGHDLSQIPPFSRLDLIACRETLSALASPARKDALRYFHSALAPDGVLLDHTGSAGDAPELFHPVGSGRSYAARKISARPGVPATGMDSRLRESEERFRILFSQAEDAILLRDPETDLILEANEAAQRLFGWSLPELLKLKMKDLAVAPEALRRPDNERRSEDRLGLPHYRRKDGAIFPMDASTAFLVLKGQRCDLWMGRSAVPRLRNNSHHKREEEQAVFIGEAVHELRSPLAIIRGSAETLRLGVRGTRDRNALLGFIENHTVQMAQLVDRLLDLSAANSAKRSKNPSPVFLAEFIQTNASAFMAIAKRRGIRIKIDMPCDLSVLADPADLSQIFGNLLDNAIKFTPKGGAVFINGRADKGEAIVSVRDTGCGIAPEDLTRIFERFFRSERASRTKGTGLGLAIVHGIVKANQGRISAENDPGGGAVFHVALPLAPTAGS